MDTLLSAFILQLILCVLLFILLFYFVWRNADLKKNIDSIASSVKEDREK